MKGHAERCVEQLNGQRERVALPRTFCAIRRAAGSHATVAQSASTCSTEHLIASEDRSKRGTSVESLQRGASFNPP